MLPEFTPALSRQFLRLFFVGPLQVLPRMCRPSKTLRSNASQTRHKVNRMLKVSRSICLDVWEASTSYFPTEAFSLSCFLPAVFLFFFLSNISPYVITTLNRPLKLCLSTKTKKKCQPFTWRVPKRKLRSGWRSWGLRLKHWEYGL